MTKKHLVVDPITRIEGHLRIEAIIDENNVITDAYSSSTMFRGIEEILKGRDPRDCGLLAMRICGVCTGTHYQRSIEAVENAFSVTIPKNARLVRNLIQGALYLHDHVVHFYHLHALDWVDITKALEADPKATVAEAQKWAGLSGQRAWNASEDVYIQVKERVQKYIKQGRLGIFGNAYWGSEGFKLTPEQNLIGLSHYLDALELQRDLAKMMAIFGGKNPHPQSFVVGGVTCVQDIKNPARIAEFKQLLKRGRKFIKEAYLPDVYMAGTMYGEEALNGTGGGLGNYMSYGGFNLDDLPFYKSKKLFPAGIVKNKDLSKVYEVDEAKITEDVTHAWYKGNTNLHPFDGVTEPNYTGFGKKENNIAYLDTQNKYSWIKSPLYNDERMEVGPLARMVVGFASNDELIKKYVTNFLTNANLPATVLFSTVGRTAARAIESELMADVMMDWVDELALNAANGDLSTWTEFDFNTVAKDAKGIGLEEAPRGALGHWVKIKDGKVVNYQTVVPSTWNAAPRDYKGRMGAYEAALIGTKVANVEQPLEILRTIHSFDPCIACAVHLIDTNGKELGVYKVNPI
ncbi:MULTISPECIES: nickel-dependent hydrogenase large subunit [Aliarcobacter]|jgi:quinone-reactive Ni/Fe-hydrogenase large subunit|uniref:Nickel-dependent hydrogenase large subunit n=7 Tax=Arcobacteraceae TaxID=2808963 RepID=A0AAU0NZQ6_9BACT|nr:nickel-dependent hydrogenase large subunit [Aliarcobacter cryaerophilus]NCB10253.1 nickel-dependent hydrogenase large subunit [Erysipelotrichia bacterium]WNL12913.1 nickel-dependent hydrogenase large subunit [Arcobacter sp. AZ-2023]WPD02270.1 nickel-dependent hydrogenase large subunit [Arcobacter sp. DSM 115972]WPD06367.1 nickel-dependent hydrogenase large subunit [Arcobacter sp. DSM 115956]WPD08458.1 nickel-dependent hydrogenase large subunit [Arcobacter sp. DSM 115955]WPD09401.1 nickel-d